MLAGIFFWICSFIALLFACFVVTARKPMYSAVSLVITLTGISGIFLTLHADFLAWILIIVYTGAVMVLIIFVVSLLNLQIDEPLVITSSRRWGIGFSSIFALSFLVYIYRDKLVGFSHPIKPDAPDAWGSAEAVAMELLTRYVLPFEIAAVLLTAAVIGAIVAARHLTKVDGK